MKLHSDSRDSSLRITAYDAQSAAIGERVMTANFVITPQVIVADLPHFDFATLTWDQLSAIHQFDLEVLLIGTGSTQHFPGAGLYSEASRLRIGLEVMTTPAACRTYNILAGEDRRVAALLTFDPL